MAGGELDRAGVDAVLNDLDEYAVEEALRIVDFHHLPMIYQPVGILLLIKLRPELLAMLWRVKSC